MKKIILHLGLPKTATTTLQHNLFQELHKQGSINFLGKLLHYDDKTDTVEQINYKGRIIRDAAEEKIGINEAKQKVDRLLDNEKLNIFSDEGILVAYPGQENVPLQKKMSNLKLLLSDYDVQVILALRQPVDYFYSLYVQLHPEFYSVITNCSTFEKYSNYFLKNPEDTLFESFNYEHSLNVISNVFDTHFFLFEDIVKDKTTYYSELSKLLSVSRDTVQRYIELDHLNKKVQSSSGTKKLFSLKLIENKGRKAFKKFPILFGLGKRIYNVLGFKKLLNKRFYIGDKAHVRPFGEELKQLENTLLLSDSFPFDSMKLDKKKLKKYGYLINR